MSFAARACAIMIGFALAGCVAQVRPPVPPPVVAPPPAPVPVPPPVAVIDNARLAGVTLAAPVAVTAAQAERALGAFRISCASLVKREDTSGLTNPSDWQPLCAEAALLAPSSAAAFFRDRFDWVVVGKGEAFATGYYEPELAGSRTPAPGYDVPIYKLPPDLIRCTRADGGEGRGRIDPSGACVYYYTRAEIEDGALAGRGLEIGWAADPVNLFFLHIQGSGRV